MNRTIVILGAGPAGLTAALELLRSKRGDNVVLLETEDSVGGLSKTIDWNGNRFDLGGHRFFTHDKKVNAWWNSVMDMPVVKRHSSIFYDGRFIDYPLKASLKTMRVLGAPMVTQIVMSYLKRGSKRQTMTSLEDFYISRFGKKLYDLFFHDYTRKVWGVEPSVISAEWGPERMEGVSIGKILASSIKKRSREPSLTDHFFFPMLGCGAFWESVAEQIEALGGHIIKNCKVVQLEGEADHITGVRCAMPAEERLIQGDIFFSSIPLQELCLQMPDAPHNITEIARRLPYRDMVVVGVLLDKERCCAHPSTIRMCQDQWIYVQDPNVRFGRIQIVNNWSQNMVSEPDSQILLALEYFCQEGDSLWTMEEKNWNTVVIRDLEKLKILADPTACIGHTVRRVSKAYPCYWDGYADIETIRVYLNTIDNLYCIGRNGRHQYSNMDHVVLSAFDAIVAANNSARK